MILFTIFFIGFFIYSLSGVLSNKLERVIVFFIFGLPIYITSLSTAYLFGWEKIIPFLQYSKELLVFLTLIILIWHLNRKIKWHLFDKLLIFYLLCVFAYAFLPVGGINIYQKLIAAKSITIFGFVYFIGRFISFNNINLNKIITFVCLLTILAGIVVSVEYLLNTHLQSITGYSSMMEKFFNQEPAGAYGLSYTFQTQTGLKRFASFFSMPLELGASTLISVSIILTMITDNKNVIILNKWAIVTIIATLASILFAVSRASFVSYALIFYIYAIITVRLTLLKWIHIIIGIIILIFIFYTNGDLYHFILNTINFTDSSSLAHLLAWSQGVDSISNNPMGIGLGASGNVANSLSESIGGENQFLIIGIQVGIIPMLIYTFLFVYIIYLSFSFYKQSSGKLKKIALLLLLIKIGLILPALTSEFESYLYISYLTWFLTGYFINLISSPIEYPFNLMKQNQDA